LAGCIGDLFRSQVDEAELADLGRIGWPRRPECHD